VRKFLHYIVFPVALGATLVLGSITCDTWQYWVVVFLYIFKVELK
jgi:hypothetical protein